MRARAAHRRRRSGVRTVVIHSLAHAQAALAAASARGVAVRLRSAPGAAAYAGAAWFREVVRLAGEAHPDVEVDYVLDCDAAAGLALAALRQGIGAIRFTGPKRARDKIAAIAKAHGARLDRGRAKALDLGGVADAEAAVRAWLAGDGG